VQNPASVSHKGILRPQQDTLVPVNLQDRELSNGTHPFNALLLRSIKSRLGAVEKESGTGPTKKLSFKLIWKRSGRDPRAGGRVPLILLSWAIKMVRATRFPISGGMEVKEFESKINKLRYFKFPMVEGIGPTN